MSDQMREMNTVIGLAAMGPILVGLAGFIAAVIAVLSGEFVGAGLLLLASSLSFGLLSAAIFGR